VQPEVSSVECVIKRSVDRTRNVIEIVELPSLTKLGLNQVFSHFPRPGFTYSLLYLPAGNRVANEGSLFKYHATE
jgi:hypothetical protein